MKKKELNISEKEKQSFQEYLQEIESPNYDGKDASWGIPENTSPLERTKYELCEKILAYQQSNNLSDKEMAQKIHLTTSETQDILYCHIDYFTVDRLITYASRLFSPSQVKVIIEPEKTSKRIRVGVI